MIMKCKICQVPLIVKRKELDIGIKIPVNTEYLVTSCCPNCDSGSMISETMIVWFLDIDKNFLDSEGNIKDVITKRQIN